MCIGKESRCSAAAYRHLSVAIFLVIILFDRGIVISGFYTHHPFRRPAILVQGSSQSWPKYSSLQCSKSNTERDKNKENADHEPNRNFGPELSRREMLSFGPLLSIALSSSFAPSAQSYSDSETFLMQQSPFSSTRQYKTITLANGLRVLLVSDKLAIRSSAAFGIGGAGQFSDPPDLPGLAHLMEHMVLSSNTFTPFRKSKDFEDWLSENEGASNAFTGYEICCFHFTASSVVFSEALSRFSSLFNEPEVFKVCRNEDVLKREVRRVASELDFNNEATQAFYLVKFFMNPDHPYSRFASGDVDTLERLPKEANINVGNELFKFWRKHYQPANSVLVVVGQNDLNTLERWVASFSGTLSRERAQIRKRVFPEAFGDSTRTRQVILYRPKVDFPLKENIETLSLEWALDFDYEGTNLNRPGKMMVTAPQVGFVISQVLGRRGPGSLYYILYRRGWVPTGMQGLPRITFPVDVSGFQLMKLEINLTFEGFLNRAIVVADVYRTISSVFSGPRFLLSRQILSQYAVIAQLHGYVLAPRPSDAIELAVDAVTIGAGGPYGVGMGEWRRFPLANDRPALSALQKAVRETFLKMSNPSNAIIITTATDKSLKMAKDSSLLGETVPFISPAKWQADPLSGAKYFRDDLIRFQGVVAELLTAKIEEDELLPPLTNNLIPPALRPPRVLKQYDNVKGESEDNNWRILEPGPNTMRLPIPRMAQEPSCRCAFVFQLLSPRPARANTRQAAYAELWKASFERAITDLVS